MDLSKTLESDCIICSVDIGTATSSVSFLHAKTSDTFQSLISKVHRVDTWPHHREKMIDIPSCLCYRNGRPIQEKFGANASEPKAHDNWVLVEAFKRHVNRLGSNDIPDSNITELEPLPKGVTLNKVYEDWLRFLFSAGEASFRAKHSVPEELWRERLFVFVAPNGWNEPEHANVRKLIHRAGGVHHDSHIRFARESEATLHYCLYHGLADKLTKPVGLEFFVCNSGASTTDIGFYRVSSLQPLHLEEVLHARSFEAGGVVDEELAAAEVPGLPNSQEFSDMKDPIELIQETVKNLSAEAAAHPKFLVMGGGYSQNKVVQSRLNTNLNSLGISVTSPTRNMSIDESPTVDGALYSCLYNVVTARTVPYTYGIEVVLPYHDSDPEHRRRSPMGFYHHAGVKYLRHGWSTIARKGELIKDGDLRKKSFNKLFDQHPAGTIQVSTTLYASSETNPGWLFDSSGKNVMPGIREVCKISGTLEVNRVKVHATTWGDRHTAYEIPYHFDIDFGSVTSHAKIVWEGKDNELAWAPATFHPPQGSEEAWNMN